MDKIKSVNKFEKLCDDLKEEFLNALREQDVDKIDIFSQFFSFNYHRIEKEELYNIWKMVCKSNNLFIIKKIINVIKWDNHYDFYLILCKLANDETINSFIDAYITKDNPVFVLAFIESGRNKVTSIETYYDKFELELNSDADNIIYQAIQFRAEKVVAICLKERNNNIIEDSCSSPIKANLYNSDNCDKGYETYKIINHFIDYGFSDLIFADEMYISDYNKKRLTYYLCDFSNDDTTFMNYYSTKMRTYYMDYYNEKNKIKDIISKYMINDLANLCTKYIILFTTLPLD